MDNALRPIDNYFLKQPEPVKSCLYVLRDLMCGFTPGITEEWKYAMVFYYYKGKMFCYLRVDKKTGQPYLGIMEGRRMQHPLLIQDNRKRVKVLYVDPEKDIGVDDIISILSIALTFYNK
ncbi:DUF1801 domain-containing protein [Mucilaginibacter hurinus]|uniref:DUF1801 domain-containing protein n=1 Tax=Mucilaginibacter hurinus TaxID=2201324 RepID=A0A367GP83_9SPHI|nr:DUF1801 domain-containing protein [Mucilaginibacter hurinus]RCH55110.1 DUF1801 domain-containing protein [Mucilaginibacter hurinus]